jgi:serine protease
MKTRHQLLACLTISAFLLCFAGALWAAAQTERYILYLKPDRLAAGKAAVAAAGAVKIDLADRYGAVAANLSKAAAVALKRNPNIDFLELDPRRYPVKGATRWALKRTPNIDFLGQDLRLDLTTSTSQSVPYGIAMVQADQLSDAEADSRTVCIIDSGIDETHPDLLGNNLSGTNDPGTGDWFTDENGHGTHVAGTIAALDNAIGVVGVLPNANINIHIVKVFDGDGWAYSSSLADAVASCEDAGADVINMSLGGPTPSRLEIIAFFKSFYSNGVLPIAAAGNGDNSRKSWPASYRTVMSVAAIDEDMVVAGFSQHNSQVEIAGPGVGVLSTVPQGTGRNGAVTVAETDYEVEPMEGSPTGMATGILVDCGLATSTCTAASGAICLIQRGDITFAEKVLNCEAGGGLAAVIYNTEPGALFGTLGDTITTIPSVGASDTDGTAMLSQLGQSATVDVIASDYAFFSGTSMATPHVAGVAALVWANNPSCDNHEIRQALTETAYDLGDPGRDDFYGYGLVQALDASNYLNNCSP